MGITRETAHQIPLFSNETLDELVQTFQSWENGSLKKTLHRQAERSEAFATSSQINRLLTSQ